MAAETRPSSPMKPRVDHTSVRYINEHCEKEEDQAPSGASVLDCHRPLVWCHALVRIHIFSSKMKRASTRLSRRRAGTGTSKAEGLYCPVSIELIVFG